MKSRIFFIFLWLSCVGLWVIWLMKRTSSSIATVSVVNQKGAVDCSSLASQKVENIDKNEPDVLDSPINVNSGSIEDLIALPGIGKAIAKDIIDYRLENGPFQNLENLSSVKGLGPSKIDKIKSLICF